MHRFWNDYIFGSFTCVRSKVLYVAIIFLCDVMELTGIATSLPTSTMAGACAKYRLEVRCMHRISASLHVLFLHFLHHVIFLDTRHLGLWLNYIPAQDKELGSCKGWRSRHTALHGFDLDNQCTDTHCNPFKDQTMMTPSNGKKQFRVTGHLCGEFTGHWWIPRTKVSDAEL